MTNNLQSGVAYTNSSYPSEEKLNRSSILPPLTGWQDLQPEESQTQLLTTIRGEAPQNRRKIGDKIFN